MVDFTRVESQELSVDVLDLQALSTPSALAADELGALGKKKHSSYDCDDDGDHNVAVACVAITTLLSIL